MDSKSLPTKAARDVPHEARLRDAPSKAERGAEQIAAARAHLPAKAAFEAGKPNLPEGKASGGRGDPPTHGPVDQQPPAYGGGAPRGGDYGGEYYVRLTVRVEDGALSIIDSHVVAGPLAQTTAFHGPFAYEVTDGARLLHAGSIPDLGTVRSFADPDGTPEQHRHHTYQQTSYEFDVRVPGAALRAAVPSNVAIILHRVKAPDPIGTRPAPLAEATLASQRSETFREVGRVVGIPAHLLRSDLQGDPPAPLAPEGRRGFKTRPPGGAREGTDDDGAA